METKKWYTSKQLWTNFIAAIAFFVQAQYGFVIDPAIQASILAGVNAFLRVITNKGLTV